MSEDYQVGLRTTLLKRRRLSLHATEAYQVRMAQITTCKYDTFNALDMRLQSERLGFVRQFLIAGLVWYERRRFK